MATLVYALDPLCGWCFAFAGTADALRRELGEEVTWEVACGGLVVGDRVAPIAEAAAYLRAGRRAVEARTPARFGPGFEALLEDGRWISNSEPACRATLVVQDRFGGAAAVAFASALSRGFYEEGKVPDAPDSLARAARAAGVEAAELLAVWDTDAARHRTQEKFREARAAGLTSYPQLFLRTSDGLDPLLSGWAGAEEAVRLVRGRLGSPA